MITETVSNYTLLMSDEWADKLKALFSPPPIMSKPIRVRLRVRGGLHGKRIFPPRGMHRRRQIASLVDAKPFSDGPVMDGRSMPFAIPMGAMLTYADLEKKMRDAQEALRSRGATFSYFPPEGKTHMEG